MNYRTVEINGKEFKAYEDGSISWVLSRGCPIGKTGEEVRTFGSVDSKGYMYVANGSNGRIRVHRIVAMAYHPNPLNLPQVDHIDRNPKNNRPENLRWVDQETNMVNTGVSIKSKAKYGVRQAEDKKAYDHARQKLYLNMIIDGKNTRRVVEDEEERNRLRGLSMFERGEEWSKTHATV